VVCLAMLLITGPQLHAVPVRITHTNIGVYESRLDLTRLPMRQRLQVVRSIERYYRPQYSEPMHQWQRDAKVKHIENSEAMLRDAIAGRLLRQPLGWLDDWARDVKLLGIEVINTRRPE